MDAGQRAIVAAKARLLSNQTAREAGRNADVSHARIVQAGIVLRYAPDADTGQAPPKGGESPPKGGKPSTTGSEFTKAHRAEVAAAAAHEGVTPQPEKGGRGNKGKAAETADFSQRRLREARTVYRYSTEPAEKVRDVLSENSGTCHFSSLLPEL